MKQVLMFTYCAIFLSTILATAKAQSHDHEHHQHGRVDFSISCSSAAETRFETGLALLHHMMYEQAEAEFAAAAEADPNCAMAYWGVAMTQLKPLWAPPTDAEFEKGRRAVEKAKELAPDAAREQSHIAAVAAYFGDRRILGHAERLAAWEAALGNLHRIDPEDVEASAFYALALLATAPPTDKSYRNQLKAGSLLEEIHSRAPEHPGLFHYRIHAYDFPGLAERALEVAREYDQIAPDVPHALHMPSHIFVRLGMWPEVISWNRRSADAAKRQPVEDAASLHYIHALDYLMYAFLQQAETRMAEKVLDEIHLVTKYQEHPASAYGLAAAQARLPLELRRWDEAAALPVRRPAAFPWDRYPWFEAITYFARGLGAARAGDLTSAKRAQEKLEELHRKTVEAGQSYWSVPVDAQRQAVAAWIAFEEGKKEEALRFMKAAADREDSVDKHPITPSPVLPARELLGDMLDLLDQPEAAMEAYKASLKISPKRFNSLYGAGRAARNAGLSEQARGYFQELLEMASEGDWARPEVEEARSFVSGK